MRKLLPTLTLDAVAIVGACVLLYGIHDVSTAAAYIVGGAGAIGLAVVLSLAKGRK